MWLVVENPVIEFTKFWLRRVQKVQGLLQESKSKPSEVQSLEPNTKISAVSRFIPSGRWDLVDQSPFSKKPLIAALLMGGLVQT